MMSTSFLLFLVRLDLDFGCMKPFFREHVFDRLLDLLNLGWIVIGVREDVFVFFLQLIGDIVFFDLISRLVRDALDPGILFKIYPDDFSLRALIFLHTDIGEKAGGPEDVKIPFQHFLVIIVPLPDGQVVHDRFPGHPVIAKDVDPLDHLLAEAEERNRHQHEPKNQLFHNFTFIAQSVLYFKGITRTEFPQKNYELKRESWAIVGLISSNSRFNPWVWL